MKKGLLFTLLITLMTLSGCALFQSLSDVQAPTIAYKDFRLDRFSLEGLDFIFDFDIQNPNRVDVRAEGYSYEFFINDHSLLTGSGDERINIPKNESQIVHVPVSMNFRQLYNAGRSVMNRDSISYQLQTEVVFDIPVLGTRRVPVQAEGYLPVIRIPEIQFNGFDILNFGISGAEFEVKIHINNPNSFGFNFSNVGYQIEVNNNRWADSTLQDDVSIAANSSREIRIPVRLSGSDLGSAIMQILSGNQAFDYKISGTGEIDVDLPYVHDTALLPFDFSGRYRFND